MKSNVIYFIFPISHDRVSRLKWFKGANIILKHIPNSILLFKTNDSTKHITLKEYNKTKKLSNINERLE